MHEKKTFYSLRREYLSEYVILLLSDVKQAVEVALKSWAEMLRCSYLYNLVMNLKTTLLVRWAFLHHLWHEYTVSQMVLFRDLHRQQQTKEKHMNIQYVVLLSVKHITQSSHRVIMTGRYTIKDIEGYIPSFQSFPFEM